MTLHRQSFIAFLLVAAVVSLFFSPLLPAHNTAGRQHSRTVLPIAALLVDFFPAATSHLSSSVAIEVRALRSISVLELHCTRLC